MTKEESTKNFLFHDPRGPWGSCARAWPYTVPETFYFPIFAFVHCSLTVRSPCVHRAFIVHSFAFTVHCSLAFTIHKAFIQRSVFIVIRNSEIESLERSDDKEVGVCFIFLNVWFFLLIKLRRIHRIS